MDKGKQRQRKVSILQRIASIIFGLLLVALALELGLRLSGFIMLSLQEQNNRQSIREKGTCRIICLGESTTQEAYPPHLREILNKRNIGIKFSVIDKGLACITTKAILLELEKNLDKYQPDIVVTMMGSNDRKTMYYQDIPEADTWLFRHCRAYRFIRLIYMHVLKKLNKEDIYSVNRLTPALKTPYRNQNKPPRIEGPSSNPARLNSQDDSAYLALSQLYRDQGKLYESEQILKKAIELNPQDDCAYTVLGWLYSGQGKLAESEPILKKAAVLNPHSDSTYVELGWLYKKQERPVEAEQAFKKAIELNPKNYFAYIGLGSFYRSQGKIAEAEQVFKKAIEFNPQNELAYGGLATIYCEMGKDKLSKSYAEKASSLRGGYYNPVTINNYFRLKQVLDKRGIRLVCVQYPVRSLQPLKKIFQNDENIIFVDNEEIFKEAIRKEGYNAYFWDMFGGDFGHCTEKGNRLLAENIASSILREVFGK